VLPEGLRRHAIDGALLDGSPGPVGANLADARWAMAAVLAIGLPLGVVAAGVVAANLRPPPRGDGSGLVPGDT
jgi:hypothetical protein